jgi:hypothetical protein
LNIRFLTVLQGADAGAAATAVRQIQSSAGGTAFSGVEVLNTAIMFPVDLAATFTNATFTTATATNRYMITGLTPNSAYNATVQTGTGGTQISISAGTAYKADSGGVLDFGPGAPGLVRWPVTTGNESPRSGKQTVAIYDCQGRMAQRFSGESVSVDFETLARNVKALSKGIYICIIKTNGTLKSHRFVRVD